MTIYLVEANKWTHSCVLAVRLTKWEAEDVRKMVCEHVGQDPDKTPDMRSGEFDIRVVERSDHESVPLHWLEEL